MSIYIFILYQLSVGDQIDIGCISYCQVKNMNEQGKERVERLTNLGTRS